LPPAKVQLLKLLKLELSEMSEDDIGKCLKYLMQTGVVNGKFNKAISQKLMKLQEKRPETEQIIHDEGLRLLRLKYNGVSVDGLQNVRDQL